MKAILVDDEKLALDFLDKKLEMIPSIEVIEKFTYLDIQQNISLINNIDVVFLDIEMPQMNGLELAEKLLEINPRLFIVFVTAFNEHAVEAFELNALDYLLKPVNVERLLKTVERIKPAKNEFNTTEQDQLKINVCVNLSFELTDGQIETINWRTTKAQELFLYLLHHRNKTVRKDQLIDLLWNHFDEEKAYSQLYTAIYHIRKSLSPFDQFLSIKNLQNGYMLETKNVVIDIVEWENEIVSLPPISLENISLYEHQMEAYKGAYLQEYDFLWAENERFRLEQLWINTAYKIANFYKENNDFDNAESWFKNICQVRPEEEDAHFSLIKLYAHLGYGMLVNYQYLQLKKEMDALNLGVSHQIDQWYKSWREKTKKS